MPRAHDQHPKQSARALLDLCAELCAHCAAQQIGVTGRGSDGL